MLSALAISTNCRSPAVNVSTCRDGEMSKCTSRNNSVARRKVSARRINGEKARAGKAGQENIFGDVEGWEIGLAPDE